MEMKLGEFRNDDERRRAIEHHVSGMLEAIREDPEREGLVDTPARVGRAYLNEIFSGYEKESEIDEMLTKFDAKDVDQMVTLQDIEFYSMCEHHILPFYGRVHVGYLPGPSLLGISKIPRLVEIFSRRLQIQEQLTNQIASCIEEKISAKGVIVIMEGIHLCMRMRGVKQQNSIMKTSSLKGVYREEARAVNEFLALIGHKSTWG